MSFKNNVKQFVFSKNLIFHCIESNNIEEIIVSENFNDERILKLMKDKKINFKKISNSDFKNRFNFKEARGVAARIKPFSYTPIDELIKFSKTKKNPLIVMVDGIEDPHNLGAILRILDAFDVDGLILRDKREVKPNETVAKISTGAINFVKISSVANLNNCIKKLKDSGYFVVATDGEGKSNYCDIKYDFPTVLIIGSEGNGVSRLIKENSDFVVKIPMLGHVNSLNASTACGIFVSNIRNSQNK